MRLCSTAPASPQQNRGKNNGMILEINSNGGYQYSLSVFCKVPAARVRLSYGTAILRAPIRAQEYNLTHLWPVRRIIV